jgi:hypothetical protein
MIRAFTHQIRSFFFSIPFAEKYIYIYILYVHRINVACDTKNRIYMKSFFFWREWNMKMINIVSESWTTFFIVLTNKNKKFSHQLFVRYFCSTYILHTFLMWQSGQKWHRKLWLPVAAEPISVTVPGALIKKWWLKKKDIRALLIMFMFICDMNFKGFWLVFSLVQPDHRPDLTWELSFLMRRFKKNAEKNVEWNK